MMMISLCRSRGAPGELARIAALAALPLCVATISASLSVSVNTVKSHLNSVHDKFGVSNQAELVAVRFAAHFEPSTVEKA